MGRMVQGAVVGYAVVTFFVVMELEVLYFVLGTAMAMYATNRALAPELPLLSLSRKDVLGIIGVMSAILVAIYLISIKGHRVTGDWVPGRRKTVLFVNDSLAMGGIETMIRDFALGLDPQRYGTPWLSFGPAASHGGIAARGHERHQPGQARWARHRTRVQAATSYPRRATVVHSHNTPYGSTARSPARAWGRALVHTGIRG